MSYKDISLSRFLIAGIVISIPAVILTENNPKYAWWYIALILLSLAVFNYPQVNRFVLYIGRKG